MSISRRTILASAALPAAALALGMPAEALAEDGKTFYLSQNGDDNAAGTQQAPWRSLERLMKALTEGQVGYGCTVLFSRGSRFHGQLDGILELPGLSGTGRLTFGAYGRGQRPQIVGYKSIKRADAWKKIDTNLWELDLRDSENYSGNMMTEDANVGFLRLNGVLYGTRRERVEDLDGDLQFHAGRTDTWEENGQETTDPRKGLLTVYSVENPSKRGDLRITTNGKLIRPRSHMTIQGLDFVGCGGHGIQVVDSTDIQILDNRVRDLGGSYVYTQVRYGNGIEIFNGSSDVLARGNVIYDVYDVGITYQGEQVLGPSPWGEPIRKGWRNVHAERNRITRCSQSFEIWARGDSNLKLIDHGPDSGYRNCSFTNNHCTDAGSGWGQAVRPDAAAGGVHFLSYNEELHMDLKVTGNRFVSALNAYMYRLPEGDTGLTIDRNTIKLKPGQRIQQDRPGENAKQHRETIEQHKQWSQATGFDKNSEFLIG